MRSPHAIFGTFGFLQHLDAIVKQYELESQAKVAKLQQRQKLLLIIMLVILGASGFLVFRPMINRISAHIQERDKHEGLLVEAKYELELARDQAEIANATKPVEKSALVAALTRLAP